MISSWLAWLKGALVGAYLELPDVLRLEPRLGAPIRAQDAPLVRLASPVGRRVHPVTGVGGDPHCGIDVPVPVGTPLVACADGVVKATYSDSVNGLGVRIRHDLGDPVLHVSYIHCSKVLVRVGAHVRAGDVVAESGASGRVTGPHVHIEVRLERDGSIGGRDPDDPRVLDGARVLGWGVDGGSVLEVPSG